MAILSKKKATFADLNCKAMDKIKLFNQKKADANSAASEFTEELREIVNQIHTKELEYKDTLDSSLLREIMALNGNKAQVERLMEIQRQAFGNGNSKMELTDEDRTELTKVFAPHRREEIELTEKLNKQLAELEKTLEQLKDARSEYHELYSPMMGQALNATGDQFAVYFLKDNQPLLKASDKLHELAHHNAFPKTLY